MLITKQRSLRSRGASCSRLFFRVFIRTLCAKSYQGTVYKLLCVNVTQVSRGWGMLETSFQPSTTNNARISQVIRSRIRGITRGYTWGSKYWNMVRVEVRHLSAHGSLLGKTPPTTNYKMERGEENTSGPSHPSTLNILLVYRTGAFSSH